MTNHQKGPPLWQQMKLSLWSIRLLIISSRPEWCFIFSGVVLMLEIYYNVPLEHLWIGILSIFLFGWGHFTLNGLADIESDKLNPRKFSLRNPFIENPNILSNKQIYYWVGFLWIVVYLINIIFIPHRSMTKIIVGTLIFTFAFLGSISYSLKSFGRLKGKPIIDLVSTAAIFAFFIPTYLFLIPAEISFQGLIIQFILPSSVYRFIEGLLFTNLLLLGIHMPTVLGDIHQDKKVQDQTTAVWLEEKRPGLAYLVTASLIIIRVMGFALLNAYLMASMVLVPSLIPFSLGIIELALVFEMVRVKSRQSVINLWKGVILSSIVGGILFGVLYFAANPLELTRYLAWFI